ncbi:MAG: hypothetical protein IJB85_04355 [Clostridia bacterium]|nr:hypothetical protein [Clostridia bacterium]
MSNRSSSREQSKRIAFCGLTAALSVALMLTGGLIPIATYCAPMAAGILLLPVMLEYGKKSAWTAYAAVALITLLMGVDKEASFFYLFIGYYPLLKWEIERIKNKKLRLLCKLLVFNAAVIIMYLVLGFLLNMNALIQEFTQMGAALLLLFLAMLNACLLLYDRLLLPMVYLYVNRIRPRLRFIR